MCFCEDTGTSIGKSRALNPTHPLPSQKGCHAAPGNQEKPGSRFLVSLHRHSIHLMDYKSQASTPSTPWISSQALCQLWLQICVLCPWAGENNIIFYSIVLSIPLDTENKNYFLIACHTVVISLFGFGFVLGQFLQKILFCACWPARTRGRDV